MSEVQKRKKLPLDVKGCPACKYRKHPSAMYDTPEAWFHWCEGEQIDWKARAEAAEGREAALREIVTRVAYVLGCYDYGSAGEPPVAIQVRSALGQTEAVK